MNPELVKGIIISAVRWVIPFVVGWLGLNWSAEKIGDIATSASVLGLAALSIWSSYREKKKLLNTPTTP